MEVQEAVNQIRVELEKSDTDLYVFQPDETDSRFFIGEGIIVGASMAILMAFLKGLSSKLEGHAEQLGMRLGEWLGEKLEPLFLRKEANLDEKDARATLVEAKRLMEDMPGQDRESAMVAAQNALRDALMERGIESDRADEIVSLVYSVADNLLAR